MKVDYHSTMRTKIHLDADVTVADEVEVTDQEQVTEDVGLWQRPVNK
jgi:hypothetical protein